MDDIETRYREKLEAFRKIEETQLSSKITDIAKHLDNNEEAQRRLMEHLGESYKRPEQHFTRVMENINVSPHENIVNNFEQNVRPNIKVNTTDKPNISVNVADNYSTQQAQMYNKLLALFGKRGYNQDASHAKAI